MTEAEFGRPELIAGIYRKIEPGDWAWEYDQQGLRMDDFTHRPTDDVRSHLILRHEVTQIDQRQKDQCEEAVSTVEGRTIPELVEPLILAVRGIEIVKSRFGPKRIVAQFEHNSDWLEARERVIELFPWRQGERPPQRIHPTYMLIATVQGDINERTAKRYYTEEFPKNVALQPTKVKKRHLTYSETQRLGKSNSVV